MDDNLFFKILWRFNAIAIAFGVLMLLILAVTEIIRNLTYAFSNQEAGHAIVDVADNQPRDEIWELGFTRLLNTETPVILIPLHTDKEAMKADKSLIQYPSPSSYSGFAIRSSSIINYFFIDIANNQKRWLFKGNRQLIVQEYPVGGGYKDDYRIERPRSDDEKTVSMVFEVINKDTDRNGILTLNDKATIGITTATGQSYTELVTGIDRMVGEPVRSGDHVTIVYQKQGRGYTLQVSLNDFSVLDNSQIPKMEK
jgi:hypothetical protein